jgi:hypothetical protein
MDSRITRNHNILDLLVYGKTDLLACGNCRICQKHVQFPVNKMQYESWRQGTLAQQAFPQMSAGDREFLISQTCETCFDKLFEEEDGEEEE